ncbi:hypothetical protein PybrP1_006264 [[Pythium] brassicae (nom. inval.)]|nr:hypothetical protein PybrP1_006264 [[Pythium] brassicae (nom. inval.)]
MVGYADGSKAYHVWELDDERVIVTRSIQVDERPPVAFVERSCDPVVQHRAVDDGEDRTPRPSRCVNGGGAAESMGVDADGGQDVEMNDAVESEAIAVVAPDQ